MKFAGAAEAAALPDSGQASASPSELNSMSAVVVARSTESEC